MTKAEPAQPGRVTDGQWSRLAKAAWRRGEAAADPVEARRWLQRARRMAPDDDTVALSLGLVHLRCGDAVQARAAFAPLAARLDLAEAWLGLAASALRLHDPAAAVAAMQAVLSRHAATAAACSLAAAVARAAGLPGWCALDSTGRLRAHPPAEVSVDGRPVTPRWRDGTCPLPPGRIVAVAQAGVPLLGSLIDRGAIDAIEGVVAVGGGWAWHPRDPDRNPVLLVDGQRTELQRLLDDPAFGRPLARPRELRLPVRAGPISVTTLDGQPLLGSPVAAESLTPVPPPDRPPQCVPPRAVVDVVIPVHDGGEVTLRCLAAVLATRPADSRVHVVDDAGQDAVLRARLDGMAAAGQIVLHRLPRNHGFPAAANVGLRAAAGRDVVLLNSDTVVPQGWLSGLAEAAYSAAEIGTACPLSNEGSILSYPNAAGGNPMPEQPDAVAALARRANGAGTVDLPTAVGFCMFMRHDCLAAFGLLREDLFAQGYGEENDWCLRAGQGGWRHVAATGCFVAHRGAASFGPARRHLMLRNAAVLNRVHPGYDAAVADWIERDPLGPARRRMDALRWRAGRRDAAVVLVTHGSGGGVERVVANRAAAARAAGKRPVLLRPDGCFTAVGDADVPNLRFRLPREWPALLRLLRGEGVERVELHHMLGHAPALLTLAERLGARLEVFIHDYASFCARINLVAGQSYCGEPPVTACAACVRRHSSHLEEPIAPASLVTRSAALLAGAARVVVPSRDTATRIQRHFPGVRPVVEPPEEDAGLPAPPPTPRPVRHVCVVGAIGVEKGYEVLLGCVQDAAARRLPLRFTVVGFTSDDERLLVAGPIFITGRFAGGDAEALIREQDADLAFIPSIWPETWCFALGEAWRAGLRAVVFDLGAPAERVRRTGWGHVLPLGLPPAGINDWLLRSGIAPPATTPHPRA